MKIETNSITLKTSDIIYLCLHWYEGSSTDKNERTKDISFYYRSKLNAVLRNCIKQAKKYGKIPDYNKGKLEATIEIIRDVYDKQWIYSEEIWKLENMIERIGNK